MEIAAAVLGVTDVALRASSKLWKLSGMWRDAPADIHSLRDDLVRTERFFAEIRQNVNPASSRTHPPQRGLITLHHDLEHLVVEGGAVVRRIEAIVDGLLSAEGTEISGSGASRLLELGKRRKLLWLRQARKVAKLRKELGDIRSGICRLLVAQNV